MTEFLSMGGYAFYVWGSYAVTFLLLAAEVVLVRRGLMERKRARASRVLYKDK